MDTRPIGVIDSGVGGLTVWQEIIRLLPLESTLYLADTKNCPYGNRPPEEILALSRKLIRFLIRRRIKAIVIACNTITVTGLDVLRSEFKGVPIIGTVPVVKKAVEQTKTKAIGILSTNRTAQSLYQRHLIEQFADGCLVVNKGTDLLVPLVEKGEVDGEKMEKALRQVLLPFQKADIDTLALGCTHFPFFRKEMEKILGQKVRILDSGGAIARQTKRVLEGNGALNRKIKPLHILYTTGEKTTFKKTILKLLNSLDSYQVKAATIKL